MIRSIYLCLIALFPLFATGKSYQQTRKPNWANGYFKELTNSYIEVVSAFDYDLKGAKNKAVKEVISRRSLATGTEATVTINNNNVSVISDRDLIIKARIIDEYILHTTNGYTAYLLVQTAKNPTLDYETISVSDEYRFSVRTFVPGMTQIYKGSKGKGATIIATEAAAAAGIILCENQRASYIKKMKEQPKHTKEYNSKANNWENGRNISIGITAGIWVYNIIDAAVARGTKRIEISPTKGNSLSIIPFATPNTAGVSLAYHF